ncbi:MAG TPA: amidophosphoribosyltransferase [Armatimonadota bacterium]|nr:amidophosphoribosyltransferase [Armatimonadota bacterium]
MALHSECAMCPVYLPDRQWWRDACGVFGIQARGMGDLSRMCYFGLFALQHRGQESAGMALGDGRDLKHHTGMGLATQVFNDEIIARLTGNVALGHVRYSTMGSNVIQNAQPMVGEHRSGPFALAHNGNLLNAVELREELRAKGIEVAGTSDSAVLTAWIAQCDRPTIEEALMEAMHRVSGAYSLGVVTPTHLIGVRDPQGVRPLSIGRLNDSGWIVTSETCALHVVGAKYVREVEPGEIVSFRDDELEATQVMDPERKASCIFEFIYFARPDSHIYGRSIYQSRVRMGHMLATQAPVEADMVMGIPETGIPHAIGYAEVSRIPFGEGFIKNRYIHRTFIAPSQRMRSLGVRMKLTPLREAIDGKRLVVVDDSIVRGTTTGPEIALLREAGAREIHVRISCPPIKFPCFYGVDTSAGRSELIAARLSKEDIRKHIGADSLDFLNLRNLVKAVGLPKHNFCTACFDNDYPIPVPEDLLVSKFDLEEEPAPVVSP